MNYISYIYLLFLFLVSFLVLRLQYSSIIFFSKIFLQSKTLDPKLYILFFVKAIKFIDYELSLEDYLKIQSVIEKTNLKNELQLKLLCSYIYRYSLNFTIRKDKSYIFFQLLQCFFINT